jgi:polysaccharide biosynthesis transport protein
MPAHAQSQSQIEETLSLVKRRIWQVLLPAVLTSSIGVMLATLLPRLYKTTTRLELVDQTLPLKQAGVEAPPGFASEVYAAKYQIRSVERVRRVLETLQWEEFETLPPDAQYRYIERVIDQIGVTPQEVAKTKALFLEITYQDTDPNHAAQFLNELRDVYVAEKLAALRHQAEQIRDQLSAEVDSDRQAHQATLNDIQELQRVHGLSPTQQAPGSGRTRNEDPIVEQRNAAADDLRKTQADLAKTQGKLDELNAQLDTEPQMIGAIDPASASNLAKELAQISTQIDTQRAIQSGKTPTHSAHRKAQKEIERLEGRYTELLEREKAPPPAERRIPNPKRASLAGQIAEAEVDIAGYKNRIAQLVSDVAKLEEAVAERTEAYRKLQVLDVERQARESALEDSNKEFAKQKRLAEVLLASEFTPFEVTEYAFPPANPSSPNVPVVIGGAAVIGLVLGAVFAMLAEFGRNAFRGPVDLGSVLPVPVLGVVNEIITAAERRARGLRRALVGTTTVALSVVVLWTTLAYQQYPNLLGPEVVAFLDKVRETLR